jgi:hypothetical protein
MELDRESIRLRPRQCGGWIGVFDDGDLRFGVTAPTEQEAAFALQQSLARWRTVAALSVEAAPSWVREV